MKPIRALVLDVDGVLTDGVLTLHPNGDVTKSFCAADGLGLRWLMEQGVTVALLSGRADPVVKRRAQELGIKHVVEGSTDKATAFTELMTKLDLTAEEVAYMGDDLVDLAPLRLCGLGAAPATARPEVCAAADWVSKAPGGRGAVRELCERLLRELGRWEAVLDRYRM